MFVYVAARRALCPDTILYSTEVSKYKVSKNITNDNVVKKCAVVRRGDDNGNYHCPSWLTPIIIIIMSIRPTFRAETYCRRRIRRHRLLPFAVVLALCAQNKNDIIL